MMWWFIGGALVGFTCFMMGYIVRGKVDDAELKQNREEMGLETDEGCYGCKDVGLPCDPKCKFNVHDGLDFAEININSITDYEEVKDEQSEKNSNQEN